MRGAAIRRTTRRRRPPDLDSTQSARMWNRVVPLLLLAVVGCGGITFQNGDEVAGTYTLRSVAGRALPALLSTGPEQLTITSGALTLEGAGDWSEVVNYTVVESGQVVPKTLTAGERWTLRSRVDPSVEGRGAARTGRRRVRWGVLVDQRSEAGAVSLPGRNTSPGGLRTLNRTADRPPEPADRLGAVRSVGSHARGRPQTRVCSAVGSGGYGGGA